MSSLGSKKEKKKKMLRILFSGLLLLEF